MAGWQWWLWPSTLLLILRCTVHLLLILPLPFLAIGHREEGADGGACAAGRSMAWLQGRLIKSLVLKVPQSSCIS